MTNNDDINATIERLEDVSQALSPFGGQLYIPANKKKETIVADIALVCREARLAQRYREALEKIATHIKLSAGPSMSKYSSLLHIAEEALKDGD